VNGDVAVGVAGRIGSGKTSLSSELATRLECPRASFGDHVRAVARSRHLDETDRTVLQDLGDALIAKGWTEFVRAVLGDAKYKAGTVVVDGIRHVGAIATLREVLTPTPLVVVAVATHNDVRRGRLLQRGLTEPDADAADSHPNESEVSKVLEAADFVVPADSTVDEAVSSVLEWLSARPS